MFGCKNWCWDGFPDPDYFVSEPETFSLPSPVPKWPPGKGFATGRISLGEIEVAKITKFERVWRCSGGATFYRPQAIPDGFFCLGHYCQSSNQPLRGYVLVARDASNTQLKVSRVCNSVSESPALKRPINYALVWSSGSHGDDSGYIWLPNPPEGYKAMGFLVTKKPEEPAPENIRCVRTDLTEKCETDETILNIESQLNILHVWKTRPFKRGMYRRGVSVGTFYCSTSYKEFLDVACLKNLNSTLDGMPNLDQIQALIGHYGPTVFFHPDEAYFPSSVPWFFKNGALLYQNNGNKVVIDSEGSNLPPGGANDGKYWIDLPTNENARETLKSGDIESAKLYVHVKPTLGGTFTDIAMWVFCPFNGPATVKFSFWSMNLKKIGQHVGDWEHFTLRISNFTGELWQVFFSQHSGGEWVEAFDLEFIEGNKPIVYSSKHGHASFPHPGSYLQGSSNFEIGVKNDAAKSKFFIDSSIKFEIIAAEYLGDGVITEPHWLQYMREWGPTVVYNSRSEIEKLIDLFPLFIRFSLEDMLALFPTELYGEEGPTGPKEKLNWLGDEIC